MKKGIALCCAACLLCLCGCGGERDAPRPSLLGQAAGVDEEAVLLTVDGREVPAWRYLYWLAFTCDQVRARYENAGLTLDWNIPVTGGTLGDYAKDQALADTALYAAVENWAETFGIALTEEDGLSARWEEQAEAHGGEETYLAELAGLGLNRERAEALEAVGLLYGKLFRLYEEADSPLAALEEDLEALVVDRILIAAGSGEEDREAARQRAAEFFARLNGAEDQAGAFAALAAEGDDSAGPRTFLPGDGTLAPALEEAAAALEEGQCTGILESEEGFSILRRLPPEAGTPVPAGDRFDQLLQQAAEESLIQTTADYNRLDAASFDQALRTLRTEKTPR